MTIKPGAFFQEFVEVEKGHNLQPTLEFKIGKRQKLVLVAKYLYYRIMDREKLGRFFGVNNKCGRTWSKRSVFQEPVLMSSESMSKVQILSRDAVLARAVSND